MPPVTVAAAEGLAHVRDGTVTWRPTGSRPRAMAVADGAWWVADGDNRILTGDADGGADEPTALGRLEGPAVTSLQPAPEGLVIGTAGAHLYVLDDDGFRRLEAFEAVEGRSRWYTPGGGPPAVRSITADGAIYVNVHVGGVVRSRDGGATWEPTLDIDRDVHEVRAVAPTGRLLAAAGAGGLLVSEDQGGTWQQHTEGLHATYCRAVAATTAHVLVSASTGHGGGGAAVYRGRLEGGDRLQRCRVGLPGDLGGNVDTGWLDGAGRWAVLVTPGGELYVSPDEGASWRQAAEGLAGPVAVRLPTGEEVGPAGG